MSVPATGSTGIASQPKTAPSTPPGEESLLDLLAGLPLVGGLLGSLSDRRAKTDVTPVRWDR
ncbi:hypothetical protein ACIOHC_43710 [Streptomyces sp. NPDC088252]|uniref:hypothetical protein n=1 Tax=unclassified Streptomyces TaxID=2593676 RepID=UPI003806EE3F